MQTELPNATAVLVLGIISIVGSFCYVVPGLICGIIALVLASQAKQAYFAAPERYTIGSYKNMNNGRICAVVGICICGLLALVIVALLVFSFSVAGWP